MPTLTGIRRIARPFHHVPEVSPLEAFQWSGAAPLEIPDPITFVVGDKWLNRPSIYPRQATLLKIIFLREDLFTEYDYQVVAEWTKNFKATGNNGIQPDVLERMRYLTVHGHKWFREVLLVMGRRAGKGYVAALAMAYILWHYMATSDPQRHYGIDRDKAIQVLIFAGKKEQAKANLWGDLKNVIVGSACFAPYVNKNEAEKVSVYAPNDRLRMRELMLKGIKLGNDMATFQILPVESTKMAGRGPASCIQGYDEMAHVTNTVARASAEEVYTSATPSLDQFGKDAFIIEPSSPWQMTGQFYTNYEQSLEMDEETGTAAYPNMLMLQLTSWDIYEDWERAAWLDLFPKDFEGDLGEYLVEEAPSAARGTDGGSMDEHVGEMLPGFLPLVTAPQTYDDEMRKLQKANPETFAVERLSHWATAQDAYLNPDKVDAIFWPWKGRELMMQSRGKLMFAYKLHGDPSTSNANFGFAIAHAETDAQGTVHAVFDLIHHFEPQDFPDHIVDYDHIEEWVWTKIKNFIPEHVSFDQWNSASTIQRLQKRARNANLPKNVMIEERTATRKLNWTTFENFKTAINMGWVHAPFYKQAEMELKFLSEKNGAVEKQDSGPVQTKDVADCMAIVVHYLIGEQVNAFLARDLGAFRPTGALSGGVDPFPHSRPDAHDNDVISRMRGFSRGGNGRVFGAGNGRVRGAGMGVRRGRGFRS